MSVSGLTAGASTLNLFATSSPTRRARSSLSIMPRLVVDYHTTGKFLSQPIQL
jgi:hypothetical protein